MRGEVRAGRREGRERRRRKRRAGKGATHKAEGGRAWGGAHVEHAGHVCDTGRVKAQRLVKRLRVLPRVEKKRGAGRGMRIRERWTTAAHAACRRGLDCRLGAGHGEERTENMERIVVTLEVFQLEMSTSKFSKPWKRKLMSVTAETSQSATGPYVLMATVGAAAEARAEAATVTAARAARASRSARAEYTRCAVTTAPQPNVARTLAHVKASVIRVSHGFPRVSIGVVGGVASGARQVATPTRHGAACSVTAPSPAAEAVASCERAVLSQIDFHGACHGMRCLARYGRQPHNCATDVVVGLHQVE
eukprot:scaffold2947_cov67-Phaeocystis_antarctica.AAC.5